MKVVFVGDKPSRYNIDPRIAFVGTQSFTNLCKWIANMQISEFIMVNSWTHDDMVEICRLFNNREKLFIALGNEASRRLDKLGIEHFKLPHPSPRNRLLNDKDFIDSELKKCHSYLEGKRHVYNL